KESMGVCFVGQVGMREFLSQYVDAIPGDIVEQETGQILGQHDGAIFYTLGQRHGLELGGGVPYYVVDKDMLQNKVFVSRDISHDSMWRKQIELSNMHWIDGEKRTGRFEARLRHRGDLIPAEFDGKTLILDEAQRAATPGQ